MTFRTLHQTHIAKPTYGYDLWDVLVYYIPSVYSYLINITRVIGYMWYLYSPYLQPRKSLSITYNHHRSHQNLICMIVEVSLLLWPCQCRRNMLPIILDMIYSNHRPLLLTKTAGTIQFLIFMQQIWRVFLDVTGLQYFPTCTPCSSRSKWRSINISSFFPLQWRHNEHDNVSNHEPHDCLLNRLFGRRSKKTSKLRVTGLGVGKSPGTGEIPTKRASNAENASISWRHPDSMMILCFFLTTLVLVRLVNSLSYTYHVL